MSTFASQRSRLALVRFLPPVLAVVAANVALGAAPSAASAAAAYCSPTGDYCYGASKRTGVWRISLRTFSFRGRVKTCVKGPDDKRTCRQFRLAPDDQLPDIFAFDARWSAHFPNLGAGRYRVQFYAFGSRIGPGVSFSR